MEFALTSRGRWRTAATILSIVLAASACSVSPSPTPSPTDGPVQPGPAANVEPSTALVALGLEPAANVTFEVVRDPRSRWAIKESRIENATDRQISVPWSPTLMRWSGTEWIALPCHDPENAVGRVCEGINAAPHVLPVGQLDDVVDLLSWPPDPAVPGVHAIVYPVWPRGLDMAETAPTLGVVDLVTFGDP